MGADAEAPVRSQFLESLVRKYKKTAFIVFLVAIILGLSVVLMGVTGRATRGEWGRTSLWLKKACAGTIQSVHNYQLGVPDSFRGPCSKTD
jgi:hypothetical protein